MVKMLKEVKQKLKLLGSSVTQAALVQAATADFKQIENPNATEEDF